MKGCSRPRASPPDGRQGRVFGFMQARIQDRVSKVKAGLFREMLHRPEGGPSQVRGPEIWGRGGFYGLGNFIG